MSAKPDRLTTKPLTNCLVISGFERMRAMDVRLQEANVNMKMTGELKRAMHATHTDCVKCPDMEIAYEKMYDVVTDMDRFAARAKCKLRVCSKDLDDERKRRAYNDHYADALSYGLPMVTTYEGRPISDPRSIFDPADLDTFRKAYEQHLPAEPVDPDVPMTSNGDAW